MLAQLAQDLRRVFAGCDVEDLGAGANLGMCIVIAAHDRGDDGDVRHVGDVFDHLGGGGGVDHATRRALHLGDGRHLNGALAGGGAAAHAHEDRALGDSQQRLRNGRLRREGVNGKDGIGIGVADDRDVGSVDERLDAAAEEREAAGLLDLVGHAKGCFAQTPIDGKRLHGEQPVGGDGYLGLGEFVGELDLGEVDRGDDVLVNLGGNIDGGLVVWRAGRVEGAGADEGVDALVEVVEGIHGGSILCDGGRRDAAGVANAKSFDELIFPRCAHR